jgi:hypothetical protein
MIQIWNSMIEYPIIQVMIDLLVIIHRNEILW